MKIERASPFFPFKETQQINPNYVLLKDGISRNGVKRRRGRLKLYCRMGSVVIVSQIPMRLSLILVITGVRRWGRVPIMQYKPERKRGLFLYWKQ